VLQESWKDANFSCTVERPWRTALKNGVGFTFKSSKSASKFQKCLQRNGKLLNKCETLKLNDWNSIFFLYDVFQ